jgi:hypothetical protein
VHPLLDRETVTLDLDATYIEHHGPARSRQGTRGTYKGKVCWHPLLCFVGETGEWLHARRCVAARLWRSRRVTHRPALQPSTWRLPISANNGAAARERR